jgi:hypothetical protein
MKGVIFSLALAVVFTGGLAAQSGQAAPAPSLIPTVTAVISDQGPDVISQTTGYAPKSATLARLDICNASGTDQNVAASRVVSAVIMQEKYGVYSSDVVAAVLAQLQQKDAFSRAQKIVAAGANTVTLLTALFRTLSPQTVAIMQAAPAIAQAVLPAVGDPRDLAALGAKIMQDNTALVLGKLGSGNDCHTGLMVARTGSVKTDLVDVQ